MSEQDFLIEADGPVLILTFNRPNKYNAITNSMFDGLYSAFKLFRDDAALRVFLIRSTGKYFSAGYDITAIEPAKPGESARQFRQRYGQAARHWLWDEFENLEKPVVVAHQGPCLGGALEMSLSCDFRLASDAANYALPELNFGAIPGSGGTSRLVRTVGAHWARWLIMANLPMNPERALSAGLIHEIYPAEEFDEKVAAFCRHLAAQPPEALGSAKLAIELAKDLDRTQGRNVERLINSSLNGGEEQDRLFEAFRARFEKKGADKAQ